MPNTDPKCDVSTERIVRSAEYLKNHVIMHFGSPPPQSLASKRFSFCSGHGFPPFAVTPKTPSFIDQRSFFSLVWHVVEVEVLLALVLVG